MKTTRLCWTGLLAFIAAGSVVAAPYQQYLSSEAVREAFFLGRRMDETTANFLAHYTKSFPIPKTGPDVARIQLLTPYAQVVVRATQDAGFSTPSDAEQEYRAEPRVLIVRVKVLPTATYYSRSQLNELRGKLSIRVVQTRELTPEKTNYLSSRAGNRGPAGTDAELVFDADKIQSAPITIEVFPPDGPRVEATFDLSRLR